MITCTFEHGQNGRLRHIVTHAIAEKEGCILLVKRAAFLSEGGKWALPGGFLDRDETAKEGVLREFREETGWEGKVISLFRINSKPNRPKEDRQNVSFEYIIQPLKEIGRPDDESSEVIWFPVDQLPSMDDMAFDLGETVQLYLEYRKSKFPLPLLV
jgi:ADP-ribose pyrophosphatase YjhB (NUDIX family)